MIKKTLITSSFIALWIVSLMGYATNITSFKAEEFINNMVKKYHFNKTQLTHLLNQAQYNAEVIEKIKRPYEDKPWYEYRDFFITQDRVDKGIEFWKKHETALRYAQKHYGVQPSIIVGIIGVETNYGENLGKYKVLNTLFTLAFNYPLREHFFQQELTQYLILCRDSNLNPLTIKGSYAGAIGLPQFMPSSYRNYAIDATGDGKIDLMHNANDAIASVANFLKKSGWTTHQPIAVRAKIITKKKILNVPFSLKPQSTIVKLEKEGIKPLVHLSKHQEGMLIALEDKNKREYWIGLHNFYVVSQYNPRINYVMAVFQLGEAIQNNITRISHIAQKKKIGIQRSRIANYVK